VSHGHPFVLAIVAAATGCSAGRAPAATSTPSAQVRGGSTRRYQRSRLRTIAFTFAGFTAGLAGLVYMSRLGSISVGYDGGTYVLYAVAAASSAARASPAVGQGDPRAARRHRDRRHLQRTRPLGISTAGTQIATALVCSLR